MAVRPIERGRMGAVLVRAVLVAALAGATAACSGVAASPESSLAPDPTGSTDVILATTTSLQDSGLLDVIVPAFQADSGYTVKTVAVGTGQALKMGEEGNADVLFVHAPTSEQAFMDAGWGSDRRLVAHNFFVIVGPSSDPAGVGESTTATEAFSQIAAAAAPFVSRGDGSGTEAKERSIWKQAGITPDDTAWYLQSGQGMGPTLQIASEKEGYTLTDVATFLASEDRLSLEVLLQDDPTLINIYSVISVNPDRWPDANEAGATAFADFVTSPAGQQLIGDFGTDTYGRALFVADAGKAYADLD